MNTATPILVKPVVANSVFPVSFLLPQVLRGWSACLIFKQNIYNMILLLWSHWSFVIYLNGNTIKLGCVHLRSRCLQWFVSIQLILRCWSRPICLCVVCSMQMLLGICCSDAVTQLPVRCKALKPAVSNTSLLITSYIVIDYLFNDCIYYGSNKCQCKWE